MEWYALDNAMAYADARAARRATSDAGLAEPLLDVEVVGGAGAGEDADVDGDGATPKPKKKKVSTLGALLRLSLPDLPLLCAAFVFLVLYAVAAASVPHFTAGLDNSVCVFACLAYTTVHYEHVTTYLCLVYGYPVLCTGTLRATHHTPMFGVPALCLAGNLVDAVAIDNDPDAFRRYSLLLLVAALCTGIFAGLRGSIFTVQMARLNARVRYGPAECSEYQVGRHSSR